MAKRQGERDQKHAEHDHPRSQEPNDRQDASTGDQRGDGAEDDRRDSRTDQQPFVSDYPAKLNGRHDPKDPGDDGPGGDHVEQGEGGDRRPDDDDDPHYDADNAFGDGPTFAAADAGHDVGYAFDQGKGAEQENDHRDGRSGPNDRNHTEQNGNESAQRDRTPITSHSFYHFNYLRFHF